MKITACIITDNDIEVLDAIESVYDSVTEIILVNTSEKFSIKKEIEALDTDGIIKYDFFKWNDSFSDARNYCISKATQDWILVIDSDEVMKQQIRYLSPEYDVYFATIYNGDMPYLNARIFKNGLGIKFKNKLHETIEHLIPDLNPSISDLEFTHTGCLITGEEFDAKVDRNLGIMLTDYGNTVRNFHLGHFYEYKKNYKMAIEYLLASLNDPVNNEHKANACNTAFKCFLELGTTQIDLLRASLEFMPMQIKARMEIVGCLVGSMKHSDKKHSDKCKELALQELEKVLQIKSELTNDLIIDINFINQKKEEIRKWQLQ